MNPQRSGISGGGKGKILILKIMKELDILPTFWVYELKNIYKEIFQNHPLQIVIRK